MTQEWLVTSLTPFFTDLEFKRGNNHCLFFATVGASLMREIVQPPQLWPPYSYKSILSPIQNQCIIKEMTNPVWTQWNCTIKKDSHFGITSDSPSYQSSLDPIWFGYSFDSPSCEGLTLDPLPMRNKRTVYKSNKFQMPLHHKGDHKSSLDTMPMHHKGDDKSSLDPMGLHQKECDRSSLDPMELYHKELDRSSLDLNPVWIQCQCTIKEMANPVWI